MLPQKHRPTAGVAARAQRGRFFQCPQLAHAGNENREIYMANKTQKYQKWSDVCTVKSNPVGHRGVEWQQKVDLAVCRHHTLLIIYRASARIHSFSLSYGKNIIRGKCPTKWTTVRTAPGIINCIDAGHWSRRVWWEQRRAKWDSTWFAVIYRDASLSRCDLTSRHTSTRKTTTSKTLRVCKT